MREWSISRQFESAARRKAKLSNEERQKKSSALFFCGGKSVSQRRNVWRLEKI